MIGPFPFAHEKLGVVETPHLGMEHQTVNAYGNNYKKDETGFDWLFHHELAHEWFGNQMTAADWDDFWLHEGYGQYMQPLYGQWREGEARYAAMMAEQRKNIINRQPLVSGRSRTSDEVYQLEKGGPGQDIYYKGAWVLHTLRYLIGDKAFFDATTRLVYGRPDPKPGNFKPRFTTTGEFEAVMSAAAGQDLEWFYAVYLRSAALPHLVETREGDRLTLEWKTPRGVPFPLPVDVQVDGVVRKVAMDEGRATLTVPAGAHVVVDPMARILRRSPAIEAMQARP
ncbi:M1 family aminopeptidase [Sphingomonas sp. J344]|uniref:M1 family aminopeptidase n=1 Tax=Sphingomonas sp. J344 TaxID=2898434 RepID=UPI0027E368B9|nr:M1 family aminopeptidase [Sphingomonas sp. J344]